MPRPLRVPVLVVTIAGIIVLWPHGGLGDSQPGSIDDVSIDPNSVVEQRVFGGSLLPADGTVSAPEVTAPTSTATTEPVAPRDTTVEPVTTVTTAPVVSPASPSSLTLAFAGDVLPHLPLDRKAAEYGRANGQPYDFSPMFEPMRPVLEAADLAICHMEVPLHPTGEAPSGYPSFGAPPEIVAGIRSAGYDGCSTASNHSLDRGMKGIGRLLEEMDSVGLGHNGTGRSADEGSGLATIYEVEGVKIAHLSWAYGFNGYRLPSDAPWAANQIDVNRIRLAALKARVDGADLVVVSLHWGQEYRRDPTAEQERIAQQLTSSPGIDLLIGHHAHVVQPISKVNGVFVVWGLGNQLSNQKQMTSRDGLTVRVHAVRGADGRWSVQGIEAIPTFVDLSTFRVLPVVETLRADPQGPGGDALRASYWRTATALLSRPTRGVTLEPLP